MGGVATQRHHEPPDRQAGGRLLDELRQKARDCESEQVINPEKLRILMLDMLCDAGVTVQLYTFFSDVIMDGERVTGVITESKSGREVILCKMLIDSTGDGDVAARAGAPFEKGRDDGGMQPMTIMFKVAGVDMDRAVFFWGMDDTLKLPEGRSPRP
ncbi:MAG: FAD-dependent oxidoreductase [Dysosmobacter sp.]